MIYHVFTLSTEDSSSAQIFLRWNYGCSFRLFGERKRIEIRDKEANSQQNHVQGMESEVKWAQSRLGE